MIGTKFYKDTIDWGKYAEAAKWCNENNAIIVEKGKYYEVITVPEPTDEEKHRQEAAITKYELQNQASEMMLSVLAGNSLTEAQAAYMSKINEVPDNVAVYIPEVFPMWSSAGVKYEEGKRLQYNGVLYRVIKEHTSQANWRPDDTTSLYAKILTSPTGEILPWEQPLSTNAYQLGDRVSHNGRYYESTFDGDNVWEPGVVGEEYWKDITDEVVNGQ